MEKNLFAQLVESMEQMAGITRGDTAGYPALVEPGGEGAAWSVVVPDLPGCFSAGDTLDEAMLAVEEAAAAWIDAALDAGREIPRPSTVHSLLATGSYDGWTVRIINPIRLPTNQPKRLSSEPGQ